MHKGLPAPLSFLKGKLQILEIVTLKEKYIPVKLLCMVRE
jgi:hypothetical protein